MVLLAQQPCRFHQRLHIILRPRNIPSHRLSVMIPITASAVHTSSSLFLSHNQFTETFHPCKSITTVGGSVTGSRNQKLPCPIVLSPLRTYLQCWYPVLCVVSTNTPDIGTLVAGLLGLSTSLLHTSSSNLSLGSHHGLEHRKHGTVIFLRSFDLSWMSLHSAS